MKIKLKHLGVVSFAKIIAVLYAFIGLLYGVMIFLASLAGGLLGAMAEASGAVFSPVMGLIAMVAMPIVMGIMGFIAGLIVALLYNLAFKVTGGLELGVEPMAGFDKEFEAFSELAA